MSGYYGAAVALLITVSHAVNLVAQVPVPFGAGSIASLPPAYKAKTSPGGPGFNATAMLSRKIYADELPVRDDGAIEIPGRPIPTNDWWTDIINNQFSGALWSYPAMLQTKEAGIEVNYPSYWADNGKEIKSRSSLTVSSPGYHASAAIAADWHDWDVVFRMPSAKGDGEITVTSVHGSPFTWFEFAGLAPELRFSDGPLFFGTAEGCTGVRIGDDLYGLYYPSGASARMLDGGSLVFDGTAAEWLVVALLRTEDDLVSFAPYATSIPRDTRVSWTYDEAAARVNSFWNVAAENLRDRDAAAPVLQGFLPHAYKYALPGASLAFDGGDAFMTPRGAMKLAVSDAGSFSYSYQFSGMLPVYGAPRSGDAASGTFRSEVLDRLMADYAEKGAFGADTYWGGKGLVQMAMNMCFAKETGNMEVYGESKRRLRDAFTDWLTYTPGEDNFFFSYYPRWGAMLGFDVSYDSDAFNDHHFHYGYFTYAAALLCMEDRDFAEKYGELLTMIAKDYANWDRSDTRFPFLRTLDPWCGHSWAGGLGDHGNDNGNGQESTSEAMQGWGGLYLLGVALGDREMRDAGIWGWSTEARATREYWFDVDAPRSANAGGRKPWSGKGDRKGNYKYDEYPYAYNSNITGKGIGWWTWFGGDPLFMHGIQWMPVSPALDYLSWDPDFTAWAFDDMMRGANSTFSHAWFEKTVNTATGETIEPLATNDWGNVAIAYLQRHDPAEAARVFDEALERNMHIATSVSTAHISYYVIHSHLSYGDPDFNIHADIPTAQVCRKGGVDTYLVYNPSDGDRTVRFYDAAGALVKTVTAPAGRLAAICADPVASDIEFSLTDGTVIPPGGGSAVVCRVVDQYGAGMSGQAVSLSLSDGAPASLEGNVLRVGDDAVRGTRFSLIFTGGGLSRMVELTVNDRPVTASSRIDALPEICERKTPLMPELHVVDQYGTETVPQDVRWSAVDADGNSVALTLPLNFAKAGKYIVTALSESTGAQASAEIFVTPPMPVLSTGAVVSASSAENVGLLPGGACDGNADVRWGSRHTDDEWLVIDLGEDCCISSVSILWEAAYAARYELQLAPDGCEMNDVRVDYGGELRNVSVPVESAWRTVADERASSAGEKISLLNSTGRYVRMRGLERGSAYGYSIYEMTVCGLRSSMPDDALIGVDFTLPEVLDMGQTVALVPEAFTRAGKRVSGVAVEWSADKPATFEGNCFTPLASGAYSLTASIPGAGTSSSSGVFVNDVERPASVVFEHDSYTVAEGEELPLLFTVMNQFMAPYLGEMSGLEVAITDASGASTNKASYDVAAMTFLSSHSGSYTLDFSGLGSCTVKVRPFSEVNLAFGKQASASSVNGGNEASLAVDGDTGTRWESSWADGQTLAVDLGEPCLIDRVKIVWEGAYARKYRLQASMDGVEWFNFFARENSEGGSESLAFPSVPARHVRILCDVRALSAYGFSIREFEVYGQRKLGDGADSPAPEVTRLEAVPSNGALTARAAASHPSGTVFMTLALCDASGNVISAERSAKPTGEEWTVLFDPLEQGEYSLRLTAADAFGNETSETIDNIDVTYSVLGINLALGKPAWASSCENNGLAAGYAVDGRPDTRWGSLFNDDEWIAVDLGKAYPLTEVRIHWNSPAYATHYSVLFSLTGNDSDYETVAVRSDYRHTGSPDNIVIGDRGRMARYVKVIGHERATGYGTSIDEIEVYGCDILTAIGNVGLEDAGDEAWYTLQGIRIARPAAPGVYIRVSGGRAGKVFVR